MCARTKVVIIDDDEKAIDSLTGMLVDYPEMEIVGTAQAAAVGYELIRNLHPDIIFLDIELPDMSGIELLDKINAESIDTYIVMFTGKYGTYSHEAFMRNEHDYLLKPVLLNELDKVVRRYRHHLVSKRTPRPSFDTTLVKGEVLAVTTVTSELRVIRVAEIGYFRYSTKRKIWEVALIDNTFLTLHKGTTSSAILGYHKCFIQTHQSYIVNVNCVMIIGVNRVELFPPFNNDTIPLGRTYRKELQKLFIMM